ncbi:hypothetical protein [Flavobacterium muglaense]|uniref:Uncharacterized protein n=1 Tax=Flavobacterium muglaense TaxID=2764716 RepID=A0A923SH20_9FLAO|nr:hypothetical protein [Flavobacterium muglaense]MBC5839648.1 hypothetical protein [Flavobacterium muglaense]MBC5846175.1 hypothetical protein [Flavobacterium muglaense]
MKILSENSPFKMLPLEMIEYQRMIFDAIRITFEMIENEYSLLEEKLNKISQENSVKENTSQIFASAWAIVDHSSRLIKLFQKLPSESNHKVLENILLVNAFRNTIQHLHERIDESMFENKSPYYGILVWHHKNMITEELTPKILVSGLTFGFSVNFKMPEISELNQEISSITIQTFDKKKVISMDLSLLLENIKSLCITNEEKLGKFFKTQGWKLCDWSKRQDIMINIKSENNTN